MKKQPQLAELEEIRGPYELPKDWRWVKLGDVCEHVTSGATPKVSDASLYSDKKNGVPFFRIQNISEDGLILSDVKYITQDVHNTLLKRSQVKPDDVLVTITGRLGTATCVPPEIETANINQHVCLIRLNKKIVEPRYIPYHINSKFSHEEIMRKQSGTTRIALNHKTIRSLNIALPPLGEQKHIVAVLESALSRVNKAREFLKESGKAIEKILPAAIKKAIPTEDPLPESWKWVKLGDVAKIGREQINPSEYPDMEFNYLSIENIESNTGKLINFSPTKGKKIKSAKLKFSTEDVLYSRLRPYLNKVYLPEFDGISATDLLPLKLLPAIDKEYLVYHLRSNFVVEYANSNMTGIQLPRIRTQKILEIPIPLPPLEEQKRVVAHLNEISERVDKLEELHEQASERVEKITQALLTKAFRGEL